MFERFKKKKKKKKEQMPIGEALDKIISGEQTGQAEPRKISQDLDRVISEIQPERKPSIKPQTEQEEQKPRAKPVDMMEEERKGGADYAKYGKKYAKAQSFIQNIRPIRKAWDAMVPDTKYGKAFRGGEIETSVISGSALKWLGSEVNSEKIKSFAEGYRQEHLGELERKGLGATGEEGRIEQTIRATPLTLSQVSVAIFAGLATGPIGAKTVGGLSMGALEGGGAYQEAIDRGATEDQAQVAARITGSINGAIEVAIPWNILNSTIGKVLPKTVLKKAKKEISKNIAKQVLKKTGKFAVSSLKQAAGEGAQEYVQEVVSNLAARYAYDPSQSWNENARGSGEVGALMGLMFSFVPGVGGRQLHIQEQAEQPPKPLEQEPAKEPASQASENVNKTFGLLAEDDKEALTELLPKMSQEEILEVRNSLVKMERQGKKDALEDRKMIEDILIDRETKSNETAKKILKEGKLESLEELPLEDRKKVIGAVEKTKDETAVGEITKERETQAKLKEEKTKLLAERKEKPEQKKEIQAKIDKIDKRRRDEFVADPWLIDKAREMIKTLKEQGEKTGVIALTMKEQQEDKKWLKTRAKKIIPFLSEKEQEYLTEIAPEAREGVAKTIKEEKGIKTLDDIKKVNPTLVRKAQKATSKSEFVDLVLNGKPKKTVSVPILNSFFDRIKKLESKKYEHKQKTTTKPKRISEPREAGKPEPKKVSEKTAEAREKQPVGRRVEEDGEKLKAKKKTDKKEKYQKMTARELALDVQYSAQYEYVNKKWQQKPIVEKQISSKEAIKIFRQFFTKEEMPIEIVERITTEDKGGAWGLTAPELVKFVQNPKKSTPYHEAVHTYLNKYATKKQWQELMSEIKKEKYGEKTEAKITNAELEEDLAEGFIDYVKTRKTPRTNIIKRFYDDVIKFLKKLVGKENKIEAFYEAIIEKKRPGYLQKTKLLLGKLRERELLYQRKRSKEYVEALKAMSKRDTKSFEDITEITDKAAFNSYFRKDINWIEELFAQSRDIYLKDKKEFVAAKMFEDSANDRRMNKSDMDNSVSKLLKPYYDLNKKSQDKLNRVLMHGDMEGKKYNKTELAELGIITKEEITAYYNIRKSFEKVLDTIVEKMREVGVSEDEIADFQRTKIGYMPHKWEHKFVVKEQKQDADGNWQTISMEDFAKKKWSMKAWVERKRQNKREDIRYVPGTLDSIDVDFFTEQRLSFENFKSIIENAKAPEDMKKTVLEAIKNMVKEKGFGRHFIRRTGVEGYDMNRTPVIIADYFSGFSGYITKMEASPKYFEALEKIDPVKQKKFYRWMRNTIAYDMGNAPEYNEIKTLAFTYYLANDISFLATNATQNFTVGIGELSKLSKGGKKVYQPEQKLLAANKDWWTQNISEEEKASVKKLLDEGRLGAEMTGELMGFKNNPLYRSVSRNLNSALFSTTAFVERNVNRVPAFLAARRILESQGITGEELNKQALDKSDDIHFRYGKQHRPMLYRKYGGPVFVFTHYIRSFMFQLSRDVKHREFVSLGRKMFYTSFFGGLTALPFAKLIVETWKEIVGDWDDDDESKEEVSRWETIVKKGVPASFGVDMSGRVSIDIFALENIKDDPKNITKWVGAAGGLIVRGHQGYEMVRQGRYIEASGKLLPDFAGNPFRGYYGYEYGVRSFGGVPLETKDEELFEYSFSEALTKGVGFSPTRETALYEKIREERKKKDKKSKKRKRLKMKIEDAKRRGDYKKRRELKRELRKLE